MPHKHFDMGAIVRNTSDYVYPSEASKKCEYSCPKCKNPIIFRCGQKNKPHFAHKNKSSCSYYEHPTESEIHREGKRLIKKLIDNKHKIIVQRKYMCCREIQDDFTLNTYEHITCQEEYSFKNQDNQTRYADVGLLEKGELKYIFEIFNTHKTDEKRQTNYNWCEIDAFKFIDDTINKKNLNDDGVIIMKCIRNVKCRRCLLSSCYDRLYKNEMKNKQIAWEKFSRSFKCVLRKREIQRQRDAIIKEQERERERQRQRDEELLIQKEKEKEREIQRQREAIIKELERREAERLQQIEYKEFQLRQQEKRKKEIQQRLQYTPNDEAEFQAKMNRILQR